MRELVKLSRTRGGFDGKLDSGDQFGSALAAPGDLDGNGVPDLVIGAPGDDAGGLSRGALWIVLLESDGSVRDSRKLATGSGGLPDVLGTQEGFGATLATLGDLDGDGQSELAVGSVRQGGAPDEKLRILFLDASHAVRALTPITPGPGRALAGVGDRNGDGVPDLAADGAMLLLNADGSLLAQLGSPTACVSAAAPGDLNGDGNPELVTGFPFVDFRERDIGSIQIAEILPGGAIGPAVFTGDARNLPLPFAPRSSTSSSSDRYGAAIEPLGDLDDDGEPELAVGAPDDPDGFVGVTAGGGAVWIQYIDGVSGARVAKLSRTRGSLPLDIGDQFGLSLASPGDLDGDGAHELVVGAPGDDDARGSGGALYVLFLNRNGTLERFTKITDGVAGFFPGVTLYQLGRRLEALDDLDGDGHRELVVAAEPLASSNNPGLFVLFLDGNGAVHKLTRLDRTRTTGLGRIGTALAFLEPSAADPRRILACLGTFANGTSAVQFLELDEEGQILSASARSLIGPSELASAGDLDGNGTTDIAHLRPGRLGIDFQTPSLGLLDQQLFGTTGTTRALAALGDLTGDGLPDLALGLRTVGSDRVLLFSMDGLATIGFEERDSIDDELLENGRAIPRPHPGRTFVISSGGANLGAAIFDSTPGGPNDPSQDPDLLVDSGNVLMLQDSLTGTQTTPFVFDSPNDDRDGGNLALDFPRRIKALSLELIDQDTGLGHGTTVTLTDEFGRTRTYDVPPGFTEDCNVVGSGGIRTLRLDTLAPQPGYAATATAAQTLGFDDKKVVKLEVVLSGSGAIDDLLYDPYP